MLFDGFEVGTGAYELLVSLIEQAPLLAAKLQLVPLFVDCIDAPEEIGIERDIVIVRGQFRRDRSCRFAEGVVGMCRVECEKCVCNPIQGATAALKRFDCIFEAW